MTSRFPITADHKKIKPRVQLALVAFGIIVVWGFVLPWFSRQPNVSSWNQRLEEKKIDASALYYAELEYEPEQVLPMWPKTED